VSSDTSASVARQRLEEERSQLHAKLGELGRGPGGDLAFDANFADTSQVTAERGELESLVGQLEEALSEVEAALQKLDKGTYGICESCGGPISPERLEAKPAARLCITCASRR
jgi:DnaK suppressor protein